MKKKHYVEFEKNYEKISNNVNEALDIVSSINLAMTTDPNALIRGIDYLRMVFGPLEEYKSIENIESVLDVKKVLKYDGE